MRKVLTFEVEYEWIKDEETGDRIESPSDWFIEGCLKDLKDSHGIECLNVQIKERKG